MNISILFVTILVVTITGVIGSEVIPLDTNNFESSIKEETWFIKFFAPWCPHCKDLAPTWTQVAADNVDYIKPKKFHMAEVDCTLYGDICEKYDVHSYPKMLLFSKGEKVGSYDDDYKRDYDSLTKYVKSKADEYDISSAVNNNDSEEESAKFNPFGTVVLLTAKNFDQLTSSGIWFVKFFAPWCGHCQKLAPIWEELGHELQYKVNVGKVDCTVDSGLCGRFKVQGYPTLKLLQNPDDIIEYKGPRQLNSLRDFAEKASRAHVLEISKKDLDRIRKLDDVLFIYLYDDKTPHNILKNIRGLSRSFFSVKFYSSRDSNLTAQLKVDKLPALIVLKDEFQKSYPYTSIELFTKRENLKGWIQSEKYPLVPAMDSENYEDILGGDRLVVLGVLDPSEGTKYIKAKKNLKNTAKLYYQQIKEEGGSEDGRRVIFAWLDGTRWKDYIYGVYGLQKSDLPTVLIADPVSNEYFDTTRLGDKLTLSNQGQLLESIHNAKKGYLVGKSTLGFVEKIFRDIFSFGVYIQQSIFGHPFTSLTVLVLIIGSIYRYCIVLKTRNVRDYERESTTINDDGSNRIKYNVPIKNDGSTHCRSPHGILKYLWQSNFSAPVEDILLSTGVILDAGCGFGAWLEDMSVEYHKPDFVGVGLLPQHFPTQISKNVKFIQADILNGLPLEDNLFDFVRLSYFAATFAHHEWEVAIKELIRVTKPGGWLEFVEPDLDPTSTGPIGTRIMEAWDRLNITDILELKLNASKQLTDIQHDSRSLTIGTLGGEAGISHGKNIREYLEVNSQRFYMHLGISPEEYSKLIDDLFEELQSREIE
ncbi:2280_t:CDS:10 [Funneliformis geosporum]|uniref:7789_t:CDS:1 n=1 Tax=Funneliformis geosporum TaxID=1117311 RepID=A0A9W4SVE2_9GLOM|nr:2280_t:CDS:10 [Funneliformis geosporum]CAI2180530.1 7789_t:CDS:10 [Funneliformis geosporum]